MIAIPVLSLAKYNQLEHLQWNVEYLANEANMLEEEKMKCTNDLAILTNRRDEYMKAEYMHELHLQQLREDIDHIENQYRLPRLDNRILGLPDNSGMYSTYSVYTNRSSSYIQDYIYPKTEDRSIRPVPSNMGLMGSDSSNRYREEEIAWKIFDASADCSHVE